MLTENESKPAKAPRAAPSARVRRNGLYTDIADHLREMIQEGELAPGSRILEKDLCEYFDISKTPLREALKVLAVEGLVTHRQHIGYRVAAIDIDEIAAVFEVLHGLEETAGRCLAKRVTEGALHAIERKHQAMVAHHHNGKRAAYFQLNQEIHQMMIDAAQNPVLSSIYAGLMTKIHRARGVANADSARWQESLDEHEAIMAALQAADRSKLPQLMKEHSEHTAVESMKALRATRIE
ncbi:GntR family transcriptional regulator [Herbaspirillum sp.]|uniref:GntR family transcriptional regulator n=1 Tax=Herbaspirillum sp. TaxID=1890675 RepID=UPI0031D41DD3